MHESKEPPSIEYSLKSISWHLKTLVEELKKLNDIARQLPSLDKEDAF